LESVDFQGPIRQSLFWKDRNGVPAKRAKKPLDGSKLLAARSLKSPIGTVSMETPRTLAWTGRTISLKTVFPNLNGAAQNPITREKSTPHCGRGHALKATD
jgi:hypothetical protein